MKNTLAGFAGLTLLQVNVNAEDIKAVGEVILVIMTIFFQWRNSQSIKRKLKNGTLPKSE